MSNRTTAKRAWRKKRYWKSRYERGNQGNKNERSQYEREQARIENQQQNFAMTQEKQEIIKVRMQSTPMKIESFRKMLEFCQEIGMCEVMNFSNLFTNKGTDKYYRAYSDINIIGGEDYE